MIARHKGREPFRHSQLLLEFLESPLYLSPDLNSLKRLNAGFHNWAGVI